MEEVLHPEVLPKLKVTARLLQDSEYSSLFCTVVISHCPASCPHFWQLPPTRVNMSQHQKGLGCPQDQCLQTFTKSQDLEVAQVSEALEETHLSSHSVMPGSLKEDPDVGKPSTSEGPWGFCSSAVASTATSSTELDEGSMSQEEDSPGTSQAAPDTENVSIDAVDSKVAMLVNFLLLKYQMKEPITEEEMLKIVDSCQAHFPEILVRASERMEIIFGLDLQKVDPANHRYDLLIKLGLTYDGMLHGEVGVPKTGFLLLILGVIFMKGNRATEDEVWEVLSVIGVYSGRKHFMFGEPRKLITEDFVKEKYLEYRQVANTDPAQFEFLWGPRAHAETTKMKLLEFLAKVHGIDPSSFPSQYEEALQDEEERAQASSARGLSFHGYPKF